MAGVVGRTVEVPEGAVGSSAEVRAAIVVDV